MIDNKKYAEKLKKKREDQERKFLEQKKERFNNVPKNHTPSQTKSNSEEDNTRFTEVVSQIEETSGKEPDDKLKESIKQFVNEGWLFSVVSS